MKLLKSRTLWPLLILMFSSISVQAIDLAVINPTISVDPIIAYNNYQLTFTIENKMVMGAEDAGNVIVTIDLFNNDHVASINSYTSGWSCSLNTGSIDCDRTYLPGDFAPGAFKTLSLDISAGAALSGGLFQIHAADFILSEINPSDNTNSISTINPSPDYNITPEPSTGSILDVDPTMPTAIIPFGFVMENVGSLVGLPGDELVNIFVQSGFSLQNVVMTSPNNTWSCSVNSAPNWECINITSFGGGMVVGEIALITGEMVTYDVVSDATNAISANISASLDINTFNNFASLDTFVLPAGPIIFDFTTGVTTGLINLNSGDLSAQTINYEVSNNSGATVIGAVVSLSYDDANFSLTNLSHPIGWSCFPSTGLLDCSTIAPFANAAPVNFQFNLVALNTTLPGSYSGAVTAIALENSGSMAKSSIIMKPSGFVQQVITDVAIATIDPDVVIDKTFEQGFFIGGGPTLAAVNSNITYKILVNAVDTTGIGGSNPAASVSFTDTLPLGLVFVGLNVVGPNFQSPYGSCSHSAGVVNCSTSTLPVTSAEDGVEITLTVPSMAGVPYSNIASVTALNDLNGANNTTSPIVFESTSILPTVLNLNKEVLQLGASVQSIQKGSSFDYRITVNNSAAFGAYNLHLVDNMPIGVSVNSFSGTNWSCTNVGQLYDCLYTGVLAANASTFIDFNVTDSTGSGVDQLFNTANVEALNAPSTLGFITINIVESSLDVVVTQNPDPVEENKPFDLIIDIINNGSEVDAGMTVVNTLPEGFSYISTAKKSASCTISGQNMTCTIANLIAAGGVESIVFAVQSVASVTGTYTNVTTLSGANLPMPLVINTAMSISSGIAGNFDYTVELSDDVDPVQLNDTFSYFVELTNTGSNDITVLDLDINIPSVLTIDFNNIVANNMSCSSTTFGLKCDSDMSFSIPSNPLASVVLVEIPVKSTTFVGMVDVDLSANIGAVVQRSANETTTIINGVFTPDLSVEIIPGSAIDQGESSSFEVKIANSSGQNSDQANNVTLVMEVTGILDNISVDSGSEWTCQVANQIVNCQFNSNIMPIGHQSNIVVIANTTQVVLEAQDLVISAEVKTESADSYIANNTATSLVGVNGTPTEGEISNAIREAIGSTGNVQLDSSIDNISDYCEQQYFSALEGMCEELFNEAIAGDSDNVLNFLREVTPNEVIGQSTSIAELAEAQRRNIQARTNQLRGGGGSGFSTAGLNARYGNSSIPLGMLAYLNQTEDQEKANDIGTNNDFISPWGFFVNGTISMGERDATGRELGFDFDTFGITAGVDYRLDAKKVIGVAIGYASFDSDIEDSAELNSQGITLTGYGSFYVNDNFYIDTRISAAKPNFDQSRKIRFTLGETRIDRIAVGETDASQYSVSMSAGYSFYKNAWNITPNASFTYMTTTIDSFTETGAGDFNFFYSEQDLESLVWSAGIRVSKALSLKKGVLTPQFDFDYNYEGLNDDSLIEARFIRAPNNQVFIIETDSPDRSYGSAGVGFVYISANGKQAYFNYRSVLGLEGFSRGTYNIGARFEF